MKKLVTLLLALMLVTPLYADEITPVYRMVIPSEGSRDWTSKISKDIVSIDSIMHMLSSDASWVNVGTNIYLRDQEDNVSLGRSSGLYKLNVSGKISADTDVVASGDTIVFGNLMVGGREDTIHELSVMGTISADDVIVTSGDMIAFSQVMIGGIQTSAHNLAVGGTASIDSTTTVSGDTALRGTVKIGEFMASGTGNKMLVAASDGNSNTKWYCFDDGTAFPVLELYKSDTDTVNLLSQTDPGDSLGVINIYGVDTNSAAQRGFAVVATQRLASAAGYVPTSVEFRTYSNSAANNYQLILSYDGNVGMGRYAPMTKLDVDGEISCDAIKWTCEGTGSPDVTAGCPVLVVSKDADGTEHLNWFSGNNWVRVAEGT